MLIVRAVGAKEGLGGAVVIAYPSAMMERGLKAVGHPMTTTFAMQATGFVDIAG